MNNTQRPARNPEIAQSPNMNPNAIPSSTPFPVVGVFNRFGDDDDLSNNSGFPESVVVIFFPYSFMVFLFGIPSSKVSFQFSFVPMSFMHNFALTRNRVHVTKWFFDIVFLNFTKRIANNNSCSGRTIYRTCFTNISCSPITTAHSTASHKESTQSYNGKNRNLQSHSQCRCL